ncbi:MAG: hypothetical protein IKI63_04605 [Clostridia bacterium]|nr:hypothetical protein [Clostridia bacterium]
MNAAKRVTLFAGHYGSGKTNVAVNYALWLRQRHDKVAIADLDVVNPYFRTKDSADILQQHDIKLISSPYANTNVDVPALPAEAYTILDNPGLSAVIDVGGDDRGALALGRYVPSIRREGDYEMLLVINRYRPLTQTGADAVTVMREIEAAAGLPFTGIVHNSNLGEETTAQDVLSSAAYAEEISQCTGLPIRMTSVRRELLPQVEDKVPNPFPMTIYVKQSWAR